MSRVAWNARIALPKSIYSRQLDFELPLPGREPRRSRVRFCSAATQKWKKNLTRLVSEKPYPATALVAQGYRGKLFWGKKALPG